MFNIFIPTAFYVVLSRSLYQSMSNMTTKYFFDGLLTGKYSLKYCFCDRIISKRKQIFPLHLFCIIHLQYPLTLKGQRDTRNRSNFNLKKWHGIKSCPRCLLCSFPRIIFMNNIKSLWTYAIKARKLDVDGNLGVWSYGQNRFVYQNLLYLHASNIKEIGKEELVKARTKLKLYL